MQSVIKRKETDITNGVIAASVLGGVAVYAKTDNLKAGLLTAVVGSVIAKPANFLFQKIWNRNPDLKIKYTDDSGLEIKARIKRKKDKE